jgi:hypothetical protein
MSALDLFSERETGSGSQKGSDLKLLIWAFKFIFITGTVPGTGTGSTGNSQTRLKMKKNVRQFYVYLEKFIILSHRIRTWLQISDSLF